MGGRLYNLYRRKEIIPPKSNEISSPPAFSGEGGIKRYALKILVKKCNKRPTPIFFSFLFFYHLSLSLLDVNTMDKAKMGGACSDPKSEIVNLGWRKLHRRWPITRGTIED